MSSSISGTSIRRVQVKQSIITVIMQCSLRASELTMYDLVQMEKSLQTHMKRSIMHIHAHTLCASVATHTHTHTEERGILLQYNLSLVMNSHRCLQRHPAHADKPTHFSLSVRRSFSPLSLSSLCFSHTRLD